MGCLGSILLDPATAQTRGTAASAMTAFDTTNARIAFTVPANGRVLVRLQCVVHGATTFSTILLGVMQGSTVLRRVAPIGALKNTAVATAQVTQEAVFVVSGLTPGANLTWDAAWGIETFVASSLIKYGGPNDATTNNAFGALLFEIWEAPTCLVGLCHDPATAVSANTTTLLGMTALDTTNLRASFTVPASGRVLVRLAGPVHGAATFPGILLGVLQGSTIIGRVSPMGGIKTTAVATAMVTQEASFVVSGLTPAANLTWDAAYGVEVTVAATGLKYGGPNDTTADNAFGGFCFEIWEA